MLSAEASVGRRELQHPGDDMPTAKQPADIDYNTFSTSMMLLTVCGGPPSATSEPPTFSRSGAPGDRLQKNKTSGVL